MSKNYTSTVLLGDLHSGSNVSLMHEEAFNSEGGRKVEMNTYQRILWDYWVQIVQKYKGPDVLILNGDLCELMQPRNRMTETWTSDAKDQVLNVVRLIRMLTPKKIYIQRGTPYHVSSDGLHVEEWVGQLLDNGYKDTENNSRSFDPVGEVIKYRNRYTYEYRLIDLAPKYADPALYHVTHHIGASSTWAYYGTAPSKAMATLMLNESHFIDRKTWSRITGLIRSHVHHYWYEESANRRMIVLPAWQFQTPFMFKVMPESVPDVGIVKLIHHEDGHFEQIKDLLPSENNRPPVFRPFG